ncbi:hypothetical protein J5N97_025938 [Dioscorea zingiberensis]|uniref:Rhodanese domain-containing protein n=1 Tax=Dioscorea zingiberensis TaxID=325984 RepID=A0A9D5H6A2_9LILI|nr:hypothetical protein J5N97_025938 [Dioscorea zingiberensis]
MSNLLMNTTATDMSLDSAVAPVTLTVEETRELLSSGHVYLDVRTAEEFGKGHMDNVVCIPYMFFTLEEVFFLSYKVEDYAIYGTRTLRCSTMYFYIRASNNKEQLGISTIENLPRLS